MNPLLPWAAGAILSLLVLALTVFDQQWFERGAERSPGVPEHAGVIAPVESTAAPVPPEPTVPPAPDLSRAAPEAEPAPFAKSPRIVPISPDGRGTARALARPEPSGGMPAAPPQEQPAAPARPAAEPRVVPISLERPQASLSPGLQLVGALASDDRAAGAEVIDLGGEAADALATAESGSVRLFIHYGAAQVGDAATATRLAEYLRRRGFEVAAIRPVEFVIERPGVRFFFARDQAESERLIEDLGWFFRGVSRRAPEQPSDFTHYTPKPNPGTVEIWLPAAS